MHKNYVIYNIYKDKELELFFSLLSRVKIFIKPQKYWYHGKGEILRFPKITKIFGFGHF